MEERRAASRSAEGIGPNSGAHSHRTDWGIIATVSTSQSAGTLRSVPQVASAKYCFRCGGSYAALEASFSSKLCAKMNYVNI